MKTVTSSDDRRSPLAPPLAKVAGTCLLVAGLLVTCGAVLPLLVEPQRGIWDPRGYPLIQMVLLVFYGIVALLLLARWRSALAVAARDRLLWLLVGLAFVSVLWSDDPRITFRRAIALLLTTLVGLYLAERFDIEGQLRLVAATLAVAALLSAATALLLPEIGIDGSFWRGPAWRGVFSHKNNFARLMALLTPASLALCLGRRPRDRWWAGAAAVSFLFPFLARSLASLIVSVSMVLLIFALLLWRRLGEERLDTVIAKRLKAVTLLFAAALLVGSLLPSPPPDQKPKEVNLAEPGPAVPLATQPGVLDRTGSFEARLEVWNLALDKLLERPWLGYGFGAFWRGREGASEYVWSRINWRPPNAHNGFLDIALGLGGVGLLLMAAQLVRTVARGWRVFQARGLEPGGLWPTLLIAFVCLYSLPETSILVQNSFLWILYVGIALSAEDRQARDAD